MSSYTYQGLARKWTPRDAEANRKIFSAQRQDTGISIPKVFKPIYVENVTDITSEFVEKWSIKQLIKLLHYYAAHRCLWDLTHVDNNNRKERKAALIDIAAALGEDVSVKQVVQKINVLRATYRYEKRRIKQRMRKGIGAKTKLKWFPFADTFLRNVPKLDKYKKQGVADSDSDLDDTVVITVDADVLWPTINDANIDIDENNIKQEIIDTDNGDGDADANDIKTAIGIEVKIDNATANQKSIWSSKETLKFVQLLKQQPVLWSADSLYTSEQHKLAKQLIADEMQEPLMRICKRVRVFKRSFRLHLLKMKRHTNYTPNFIWWSEAMSFMTTKTCAEQHFVDTNQWSKIAAQDVVPISLVATATTNKPNVAAKATATLLQRATPTLTATIPSIPSSPIANPHKIYFNEVEINDTNETQDSYVQAATPINPISSVPPASISAQDIDAAFDTLFDTKSNDENASTISNEENLSTNSTSNSKVTNTKLIWNGLEVDLLEGKWSLKYSVKFLRLYGAHRCLWHLNDEHYRSREMRYAALVDIAAAMGHNLDVNYVAKKIKIFRITYMQHRKRILAATLAGKKPDIQLRWFPLADSFLRPHIGLRSIKERECEMPQFDYQYVYANLNLIEPSLLTDFRGKGTQNIIDIGGVDGVDGVDGADGVDGVDGVDGAVDEKMAVAEIIVN